MCTRHDRVSGARITRSGSLIQISRLGFAHRAEVVAAPGTLVLQLLPDLIKLLIGQRFVQYFAPDDGALYGIVIKRAPGGVGRQHRTGALSKIGSAGEVEIPNPASSESAR